MLCQGALSLWSYASSIPFPTIPPGKSGFFNALVAGDKVSGPIVTTHSFHDLAVGLWYPLAAGVAGEVSLAGSPAITLPEFGGLGSFGIQGLSSGIQGQTMRPVDQSYGFQPGTIYNLESSQIINAEGSIAGAHNDIAHPEVAHAFWEAVRTT